MAYSDLVEKILSSSQFSTIVAETAKSSVIRQFPVIKREGSEPGAINWPTALLCASAITDAASQAAQDAALRVVQACLVNEDTQEAYKRAAAILLERMGNWPALRLATERDLVEPEAWLNAPSPLQLDVVRRRLELTIPTVSDRTLLANVFQRNFWTAAAHNQWLSVSAPTSAGKSFVVKRWFEEQLARSESMRCVYLVPTRALIEEVSRDFKEDERFRGVGIHTLPWDPAIRSTPRSIQVLTQERLHLLLQEMRDFRPSILFVDEAQKFGDDARGILLQRVLRDTSDRNPSLQVLLASPLSSNPELLLQDAPQGASREALRSESVTVNQNLLWVNQERGHTRQWNVELILNGAPQPVGSIMLTSRPTTTSLRLSLIAAALGRDSSGNVVYVNGAADAEKTAQQIYDTLGSDQDISADDDIVELRDLVRKTVHPQYSLAFVLTRGIAFHYGNMPLLIRTEVERLFRLGKIKFLVCTSTLLEGVNLPCANIFVRGPRKGKGKVMSAADFWNLAGRAGRWGREFQGNIVCIDTSIAKEWPLAPTTRVARPLTRATSDALSQTDRLIAYIDSGTPIEQSEAWPLGEPIYSYLAGYVGRKIPLSSVSGLGLEQQTLARLQNAVEASLAQVEVPYEVYSRHAGISPVSMQRLLDYFNEHPDPGSMKLAAPESPDAAQSYARAIYLVTRFLGQEFSQHSGRHMQLAILLASWMRGIALAQLIQERIDYNRTRDEPRSISTVIRETMVDVEQIGRFHAPKYLACYADLLRLATGSQTPEEEGLPDITMMLELGVSRITDVSLMTLGLSRTSVVLLAQYITADSLTPDECLTWLRDRDLDSLDLPELVRREVREMSAPGVDFPPF